MRQDYALAMVRCKVVKQLELLDARKWEDPDLEEDIKWVSDKLETSVQDLRWVAGWDGIGRVAGWGDLRWVAGWGNLRWVARWDDLHTGPQVGGWVG